MRLKMEAREKGLPEPEDIEPKLPGIFSLGLELIISICRTSGRRYIQEEGKEAQEENRWTRGIEEEVERTDVVDHSEYCVKIRHSCWSRLIYFKLVDNYCALIRMFSSKCVCPGISVCL